jgi:hypothetical protein
MPRGARAKGIFFWGGGGSHCRVSGQALIDILSLLEGWNWLFSIIKNALKGEEILKKNRQLGGLIHKVTLANELRHDTS